MARPVNTVQGRLVLMVLVIQAFLLPPLFFVVDRTVYRTMTSNFVDDHSIDVTSDECLHSKWELFKRLDAIFIEVGQSGFVVGGAGLSAQNQFFVVGDIFDTRDAILIDPD